MPGACQAMRIKCVIEYDGTDFVGWQRQTNGRSVQCEIERVILRQFGVALTVHGAGRTDAGVHASGQVAHFDLDTALAADRIAKALNAGLPADVAILTAERVPEDFHARYSASSRAYAYTIRQRLSPLHRRNAHMLFAALDVDIIRAILPSLFGMHDFSGFSKRAEGRENHFCHVFHAEWIDAAEFHQFRIKANRFLTGMVRAIVGGLIMIGRGAWSADDFNAALENRHAARVPMLAPAHGLTLERVSYDPVEFAFIRDLIRRHGMVREQPADASTEETHEEE